MKNIFQKKMTGEFRLSLLTIVVTSAATFPLQSIADTGPQFNNELLITTDGSIPDVDLSVFNSGQQAPGVYNVDIHINDDYIETRDVDFKLLNVNNQDVLTPCITSADFETLGVNIKSIRDIKYYQWGQESKVCVDLASIKDAHFDFDFNKHRLTFSIPHANLYHIPRGYIPPEKWDDGINATYLNYYFDESNVYSRNGGEDQKSRYLNLRPGINLGAWRLRNYTTYNKSDGSHEKWDSVYTYAQRGINSIKSQLVLGESSTPSDVFDSVQFRGIQLGSDEDMYPESLKGYAPSVRGVARTNAQVIIRQNGYIIYQRSVAPGNFSIDDMYPTGSSGDLYVTIKETDGSERQMIVPFSSVPMLQREGRLKYSVMTGQYRSYHSGVDHTPYSQATAMYGLKYGTTLYGGMQAASSYQSLAFGIGKNFGDFGAVSLDATQAWSKPREEEKQNGRSFRIRYNKNIADIGTNFAIASYRYSTEGFYDIADVLNTYGSKPSWLTERLKDRTELSMNQRLGDGLGVLSLSLANENYWNANQEMTSLGMNYNNSWGYVTYDIGWNYNRNVYRYNGDDKKYYDKDNIFSLNISVPLNKLLGNTWVTYGLEVNKGSTYNRTGLSGTALENNKLSWGVQESYGSQGNGNAGSLNMDYRGTFGDVNGNYGYSRDMQKVGYGAEGSLLLHSNGLTFAQSLGETSTLIKAPGADFVSVDNQTGVSTDYRGYTAVPYNMPFRKSEITLDTATLGGEVELERNSQTVVPTRGAIVLADFSTNIGKRALFTLLQKGGNPVPFGASVFVKNDSNGKDDQYFVGDAGQVYVSGLKDTGVLKLVWGRKNDQVCVINYALNDAEKNSSIYISQYICK